jgi:peptidase C39-like protein
MTLPWPRGLLLKEYDLPIRSEIQPDDTSCGISCLKMLLAFHGISLSFDEMREIIPPLPDIGLYDSHVGKAALDLGFSVTIYSYNYTIFHPLWNHLTRKDLIRHLSTKNKSSMTPLQEFATKSYIEFMEAGGEVLFYPLSKELLLAFFEKGLPVMVALDMCFLYDSMVYYENTTEPRATHFVVLHGYNPENNTFRISDPWHSIPLPNNMGQFSLDADRVINAIFLGQNRNDAAVVVIQKNNQP